MNKEQLLNYINNLIMVAEGKQATIGSIYHEYWELKGYLIALRDVKDAIMDTSLKGI